MSFEIPSHYRTLGTVAFSKDLRIIATLKNGKEITADVAAMSASNFRVYLRRLLDQDLTDDSRERILEALASPEQEDEPVAPVNGNGKKKGGRKKSRIS